MKRAEAIPLPGFAYVPGQTARHDPAVFEVFHDSIRDGMTLEEIECSLAWQAGWRFIEAGFHWEAHEVLEPVWMALPDGGQEKQFVQAVIQLANAELKARMGKPNAVRRLCDMAEGLLEAAGLESLMGVSRGWVEARLETLRLTQPRT